MQTVRWKLNRITVAALTATVVAGHIDAQAQRPIDIPAIQALQLRGVADLPAETLIDLARTGKPIWHVVDDASLSLASIIQQECGQQLSRVADYISTQAIRLNVVDTPKATFRPGHAVAIPFCLKIEENGVVKVLAGDTPSEILKREYGVFGQLTTLQFYELNNQRYASFEAFANNLRIGDFVTVPFTAEPRIYNPLVPARASVDALLSSIPERNVREQVSMSITAVTADPERDRFAFEFVKPIEFTGVDHSVACNGAPGQVAQIVDARLLAKRFDAEKTARDAFFSAAPASVGPPSTTVGIVDSGLATIGDDFFALKFFLPNIAELNGEIEEDENDNELVDDVYGRTYSSFGKPGNHSIPFLAPFDNARDAAHGTKMAALVLGGVDIARDWTASFSLPPVQLKVVKFTDSNEVIADPVLLQDAIQYLKKENAQIFNLSLASTAEVAGLENEIQSSRDHLYIVAAGNDPAGGLDLSVNELFPAGFGGKFGEPNVVTVGAHDLSGMPAKFSYFSENAVDLFAPGCAVQTRDHKKNTVQESGTSPAAAIVSFTAALMRALGLHETSKIKHRLLVGTDFDPKLLTKTHSGGRLNVIKAISVYHDIIELDDRTIFGVISDPKTLLNACLTPPVTSRPVHKVAPNIGATGAELTYWLEAFDRLERQACTQTNSAFGVSIIVDGAVETIPLEEIREIIIGTNVTR